MPPCMGKTIAAVFLRLPAVSVKGFLSWLLLSALLLQLPEPVSDALLFGQSWIIISSQLSMLTHSESFSVISAKTVDRKSVFISTFFNRISRGI